MWLKDPEGVRKSSGFLDLHYRPVTYAWKGEVATAMHAFIDDEDHGQQVQSGMARQGLPCRRLAIIREERREIGVAPITLADA
jgi:hypothetical protein